MDWKDPFRIAFEFGMWSLGWLIVLFVGIVVLFVSYAIVSAFYKTIFKKGKTKEKTSPKDDLEAWAKSKSLKVIKNKDEE